MTIIIRNDGKPARKANRLGGVKSRVKPTPAGSNKVKVQAGMVASRSLRSLVKVRRSRSFWLGKRTWEAYCRASRCKWDSKGHQTEAGALAAAIRHREENKYKLLHGARKAS